MVGSWPLHVSAFHSGHHQVVHTRARIIKYKVKQFS